MNRVAKKVIDAAERELGGIGPSFMKKQMERLGLDEETMGIEAIDQLAVEASKNCLLLVGKVRAENLRNSMNTIAEILAEA